MSKVTKKDLQKALASKTETASKTTSKRASKTASKTVISTKEANKKIQNEQKLTKEEVTQLQQTAQDKIIKFDDSLAQILSEKYTSSCNSKNEITLKRDSISFKLCYKSQKQLITVYSNTASNEMRNKMLELYNYSDNIKKTSNSSYLNSKVNKEFKLEVTHVTVDNSLLTLIDEIFENIKQARIDANKSLQAKKKAK
jgi:hypothetical protein